jgi:hypothetical protein
MKLFKEFRDVFAWSYEEIPGIDPKIVQHKIRTYENENPSSKKLRPANPRKVVTIKVKVEKFLNVGFIYPLPLTEWVSNPVLVDKKKGTIQCMHGFLGLK